MNKPLLLALLGLVAICRVSFGALGGAGKIHVVMSQNSCRIHGVEIIEPATIGSPAFFSLQSAQKALGNPDHINRQPRVWDYVWQSLGIHLQKGTREPLVDNLFKLQIFFEDTCEKVEDNSTGAFPGSVCVEWIDFSSGTDLQSIRPQLEKAGFKITGEIATKGKITIFFSAPSLRVNRIEQWCP